MQNTKHIITTDQINALLGTIYQTNVTAATFDSIKKFFTELETVESDAKVAEEAPKTE